MRSRTSSTLDSGCHQTLIHAGYVEKDEEAGGHRGTIRLFELGARQLAQLDVRRVALPLMRALAERTDETVHLSVLDGLDVVYVEKIDSAQPIRAYSMVGGRGPAYAVATGKALLAYQHEGYLDGYAKQLMKHTAVTITSLPALKDELQKVARLGYAVNNGEWREGVGGVAATVFNGLDQPIAAVGISGPLERLNERKMKEFAPDVQACALKGVAGDGVSGNGEKFEQVIRCIGLIQIGREVRSHLPTSNGLCRRHAIILACLRFPSETASTMSWPAE